jgi:hypothetical protein
MKNVCVALSLLFLLSVPLVSADEIGTHVKIIKSDNTIKSTEEINSELNFASIHSENESNITENVSDSIVDTGTKEESPGILEDPVKAAQMATENALYSFCYGIADEFVKGSFILMGTEANVSIGPDGKTRALTYSVHAFDINPFEVPFVIPILIITASFYLGEIFIVIFGSLGMLAISSHRPEEYSRFRHFLVGEEKPYNIHIMNTACSIAIADPVLSIFAIVCTIWIRNTFFSSIGLNVSSIIAATSDSLPTWILTGVSLYVSAFQMLSGEFGLIIIICAVFIRSAVSSFLLMIGALQLSKYLNIAYWGTFIIFCIFDFVNILSLSAGIATAAYFENGIFCLIGTVFGALCNAILLIAIIIYSIFILRNTARV